MFFHCISMLIIRVCWPYSEMCTLTLLCSYSCLISVELLLISSCNLNLFFIHFSFIKANTLCTSKKIFLQLEKHFFRLWSFISIYGILKPPNSLLLLTVSKPNTKDIFSFQLPSFIRMCLIFFCATVQIQVLKMVKPSPRDNRVLCSDT